MVTREGAMSLQRDHDRPPFPAVDSKDKSAADLERDRDRIRAEMDRTIDLIEHRLAPSRLINQAFERMRVEPGAWLSNCGEYVRRHPVPAALLAAGIGWFVLSEQGDRAAAHAPERRRRVEGRLFRLEGGSVAEQGPDVHTGGGKSMSGSWDETRRDGEGQHSHARFGMHTARDAFGQVGSVARRQGERARTGFEHMLEEQPLLLGAVAMALGAVLGATLPTTRIENRYLGPTREQLQNRASDYVREQWEKAKEVGRSAGTAAVEQAEAEGITPDSMYDQAKEKLSRVAQAASDAAQDESDRQNLGGGRGSPVR